MDSFGSDIRNFNRRSQRLVVQRARRESEYFFFFITSRFKISDTPALQVTTNYQTFTPGTTRINLRGTRCALKQESLQSRNSQPRGERAENLRGTGGTARVESRVRLRSDISRDERASSPRIAHKAGLFISSKLPFRRSRLIAQLATSS